MKKPFLALAIGALFTSITAFADPAITFKTEKEAHPQIVKAIEDMNGAIQHMKQAAHDFNGHKADAIAKTKEARHQLILALFYRLKMDDAALTKACAGELKGDAVCVEL
jgi:hypothetical protein